MIQLLLFVLHFSLSWVAADVLVKMFHFFCALISSDSFVPHTWVGLLKLFGLPTKEEIHKKRRIICSSCSTSYEYGDCYTSVTDPVTGKEKLVTKTCSSKNLDNKTCGTPLLIQRSLGKGKILLVPLNAGSGYYTYMGLKDGVRDILMRPDIQKVRVNQYRYTLIDI
jgi:hypothetical protein